MEKENGLVMMNRNRLRGEGSGLVMLNSRRRSEGGLVLQAGVEEGEG